MERDLDASYESVVNALVAEYPRFNEIGCREKAAHAKHPGLLAIMSAMATVYVAHAVAKSTTKHEMIRAAIEGSSLSLDISAHPNTTFGCYESTPEPKCLDAAAHRATQRFLKKNEGVRPMILVEHLRRVAEDVGDYHDLTLLFGSQISDECLAPANPDWSAFPITR